HGFWYTGISVGWTWGYGPASAQRNVIEHNDIHHTGIKADGVAPILSDMGGIYTLGNQEGTIIRGNRFHDIAALKYGGWGIYFDEGTTHLTAENNLVYRTTHGGFHQHYGRENVVRNNIFAYGRDAQIQRSRVEDHESFRFERNIVLWKQGNLLAGDWHKLNASFDRNTYWRETPGGFKFADRTWDQWRQAGVDANSKIADPKFVNSAAADFRLTAGSAGSLAGFQPFDLSNVGPRPRP
ncbi:MAG TPA: right-handed parallel beta-helix repeat-containing protein, partial [Pirellulales bacterium]|nr:right-handed parallel beta-helix repeat-containing protein [Pirellulales bacterium]